MNKIKSLYRGIYNLIDRVPTGTFRALFYMGLIITFAHLYHAFFSLYKIQSPVVIELRPPVVSKFLSPLPEDQTSTVINLQQEQKIDVISPTPTVTPTPVQKALKMDIINTVEASDIDDPTDAEIIAYIESKDWDDEIAVALAKSENFWNKTHSFDCGRIGGPNENGSYDYGLFQINDIHAERLATLGMTMEDMLDCEKNIDYAFEWVYSYSVWGQWSAYNNGSYLNHL